MALKKTLKSINNDTVKNIRYKMIKITKKNARAEPINFFACMILFLAKHIVNLFLKPFPTPKSKKLIQVTVEKIASHIPYSELSKYFKNIGIKINVIKTLKT